MTQMWQISFNEYPVRNKQVGYADKKSTEAQSSSRFLNAVKIVVDTRKEQRIYRVKDVHFVLVL